VIDKIKILNELKRLKKFSTDAEFAAFLEISPQNLSNWYKRNTFNENKIVKLFPEVNYSFIRTGEGEILKSTNNVVNGPSEQYGKPTTNQNGKGVKYFDVDFIAGFDIVLNNHTVTPAYYIDFKPYNKADYWVNVTGHSMDPLISHGDIIAIKKLNDWKTYYLPGEIYAIVTDEFRTIKKIRKGDNEGEVLLVPENLEDFDPKPISISLIRDVYQVLGCMKKII